MIEKIKRAAPDTEAIAKIMADKKMSGKVIAICNDTGRVLANAANIVELKKLMNSSFPDKKFRFLCCP